MRGFVRYAKLADGMVMNPMPDRPRHELNYASPGEHSEQSRRRFRFLLGLLVGAIITGVLYVLFFAAVILLTRFA